MRHVLRQIQEIVGENEAAARIASRKVSCVYRKLHSGWFGRIAYRQRWWSRCYASSL